jgi:hypothetical protein
MGLISLTKKMVSGEVAESLRRVKEKGVTIKCVIPEFDVIYSLREFMELLEIDEEEALELVAYLTATTHASFAMNAGGVGKAVAELS